MDDSGAPLAADAAQIVDVMEQRVDERAARMSGGGMDDHARRLVDDDQVAILVDDVERQRFGLRLGIDRLRDQDFDLLSTPHALIRPGGAPGALHAARFDQALDLRPRLRRQHRCEKAIEPERAFDSVVRDGDRHAAFLASFGDGATARDRYTSMTTASGASSTEMNCDVDRAPTLPRSSPR